jgi:hypothetical protein
MTLVKSCNTKGKKFNLFIKKKKSVGIKFKRKREINGLLF